MHGRQTKSSAEGRDKLAADKDPWKFRLSETDRAFQPIVNIHTDECHGFEPFSRNCRRAGFDSITELFGQALRDGVLKLAFAVTLEMPPGRARRLSPDSVGNLMAQEKKKAKTSPSKISVVRIDPPDGFSMENVNSYGVGTATKKLSVPA